LQPVGPEEDGQWKEAVAVADNWHYKQNLKAENQCFLLPYANRAMQCAVKAKIAGPDLTN